MLLGAGLLESALLSSHAYSGTWEETYSFEYLAGVTVILTPTLAATIPDGSCVDIYAGESLTTLTLCPDGEPTSILFLSTSSGTTNLFVRLVFRASTRGVGPRVTSLGLLIQQSTSLYTIATQILASGLTDSNGEWDIDTEIQKYLIPHAWFKPTKHRAALAKVAEACGGVAYQDRYGVVRLRAGNFLLRNPDSPSLFSVTESNMLSASSPVSSVKNRIRITTKPYAPLASQTLWELTGDKTIDNGETRSFDIKYSDYEAAIDCAVVLSSAPAGASISVETHYSWGAHVEILGSANGQVLTMSITGKPLEISGSQVIERTDGASIRRNGDRSLVIDDNDLIQSEASAALIAEDTLAITKQESRDIESEWRGDPTLELEDIGTADGFRTAIISQEGEYNGMLKMKSRFRKV